MFRSTPASRASDAAECRPSCSLITGTPAAAASTLNRREISSGGQADPSSRQNTGSFSCHALEARSRAASCALRCALSSRIVSASSHTLRAPAFDFGLPSTTSPPICRTGRSTLRYPASRSPSSQRNPAASPRRAPRSTTRRNIRPSRSSAVAARNRAASAALQRCASGVSSGSSSTA
ncbi:MAG TPA: hypothetical protein VGM79_29150 [Streptosporangiaceae bacterium]